MKISLTVKLKAIEDYLRERDFKKVAANYQIHHATLRRWLKKFQKYQSLYRRPGKRLAVEIEKKVVLLKENNPGITLTNTQRLLGAQGIKLSIKGIYEIWKRYGIAKRPIDNPFSFYVPETAEIKDCLEYVRYLMKISSSKDTLKKVAEILNSLPGYPAHYEDILEKIPDRLLSLRRRFDKLYSQFLKIPTPEFYKKIHRLRLQFEKKEFFYSALITGLMEVLALHWMRTPEKEIELHEHLKKLKGKLRDPILNFQLTFLEATACLEFMEIAKAKMLTHKAMRLLKCLPYFSFYESMGDLMTFMGDYRKALIYQQKALELTHAEDIKRRLYFKIARYLTMDGRYKEAIRYLNWAKIDDKNKYYGAYNLTHALINLGLGRIEKSINYLKIALEKSEQEQFRNTIFTTVCCYGAINCAMGKIKEARDLLRDYLPIIKKYGLKREAEIMENLLNPESLPPAISDLPTVYLVFLLKLARKNKRISDYKKLCNYAKKYGIRGFLHRCFFFIPEPALNILSKGRNPELPKCFLKLPLFNAETPVYYIKLLGEPVIYKNQDRLRIMLRPKEIAILLYIALNAPEPGKSISLVEIYNNFWFKSPNPEEKFSHLLVNLKKKLALPKHLLTIQSNSNFKILINNGFFTDTDYNDFQTSLTRAKALEREGEWKVARKEYLRAFKLFRGEPFKKNFDNWSVDMRFKILSEFETEAIAFVKSCIEHGNKNDARRILQKVLKIIPDSEEARNLSDSLNPIIHQ